MNNEKFENQTNFTLAFKLATGKLNEQEKFEVLEIFQSRERGLHNNVITIPPSAEINSTKLLKPAKRRVKLKKLLTS